MPAQPWIPRADPKFRNFAAVFCNTISADPARYMMTPAEAAALMARLQVFLDAFAVTNNQATRTRPAIIAKDDARSILENSIRSYGGFIRVNGGISDGDKINIGVPPRNVSHKKRMCPSTPPLLNYIGSLPGMDQLVFHDSSTPTSKAKPYGAERLELWVAYRKPGEPQPKREDATLIGSFKKSKMIVPQDARHDVRMGGTGTPIYWGRWVGFDGEVGPWSLACFTTMSAKAAAEKTQTKADDAGEKPLKLAA